MIKFKEVFYRLKIIYVAKIPIPNIDKGKEVNKNLITQIVTNLLNLNNQLPSATLDTQRRQLQRAIEHAEKRIDELVYQLYGLTEEEVKVVEGNSGRFAYAGMTC